MDYVFFLLQTRSSTSCECRTIHVLDCTTWAVVYSSLYQVTGGKPRLQTHLGNTPKLQTPNFGDTRGPLDDYVLCSA